MDAVKMSIIFFFIRYGIVEKLKEEYILVLYKNYQVTVEKYHI